MESLVPWECSLVFLRCLIADTMQQFGYQHVASSKVPLQATKICTEPKPDIIDSTSAGMLNGNSAYHRLHAEEQTGRKP
ncbi:hypothetical protein B566_EDAN014594 [Ephemera danica]|nr:hypothetical protein B566_EDAN014594 [Ephemera danica]